MSKLRNILSQIQDFRSDLDVKSTPMCQLPLLVAIENLITAAIDVDEKGDRFKEYDSYHEEKIRRAVFFINQSIHSGGSKHVYGDDSDDIDEIRRDVTKVYWLLYDSPNSESPSVEESTETYDLLEDWIDHDYLAELNGTRP
ncbi:hypothetical protein KC573_00275 [candidate division WWE3 bacterium]|uniref:Uncharacterized protein n=1 Tax=candidate division WWE3 bacterium TaxID=2053526 RepID=A0A955RWM8_UNCKA|nr:hypothetical protein [candidate division WWE3 bacterium]